MDFTIARTAITIPKIENVIKIMPISQAIADTNPTFAIFVPSQLKNADMQSPPFFKFKCNGGQKRSRAVFEAFVCGE